MNRLAVFAFSLLLFFAAAYAGEVSLLDGKLSLTIPEGWAKDKNETPQAIASYRAIKGDAWGAVVRGTHGLEPSGLKGYRDRKVAEYTKGFSWVPNFKWLKKDFVTIGGRPWVDLRYIGLRDGAKNSRDGLLYTRFLSTSFEGQLLEITFTSNTDPDPATKAQIDAFLASVKLSK